MAADPWHFERSEFTSRVLTLLVGGPGQALTLFAPRRTGKTEFLLKDLAPLAEARGHRVVYASFWQAPLSPLAVLLHALETSLRRGALRDRLRSSASALAPKLKLSAPATGMEATIDLTAVRGTPPADLLLHMDDLLDRLSRRRKTTILLLDEVQELAIKPTLAAVRERIALDLGYPETWLALTAIQRATARALAAGADQPFGQPFRRRVGGEIGETAVSAGHIQAALRRLERAGLADTHTGRWALADPEFAAWIREHDGESR